MASGSRGPTAGAGIAGSLGLRRTEPPIDDIASDPSKEAAITRNRDPFCGQTGEPGAATGFLQVGSMGMQERTGARGECTGEGVLGTPCTIGT